MTSKGQTQLDYAIGFLLFITFISTVVFLPTSPLYIGQGYDNTQITETEYAATTLVENELRADNGKITNERIESVLNDDDVIKDITSDGFTGSIQIKQVESQESGATNRNLPPVLRSLDNSTDYTAPTEIGTETTTRTIEIDGQTMLVEVRVWYE